MPAASGTLPRKRALLDTNVWRYVIDSQEQVALLHLARTGMYDIQIAPAVLYETLRLKDAVLRARLIKLMTNRRFHRLMPEAYTESMEILDQVKRLRPDWLRPKPDLTFFHRLRNDWSRKTGGFWVRCEASHVQEAKFVDDADGGLMDGARKQSQMARAEMIAIGWKTCPPLSEMVGGLANPHPGWNGEKVEAWRIDSLNALSCGLSKLANPYRDWIGPFVDLDCGLLRSAAWVEFWLHRADAHQMPRQWMRWAFSFVQRFRKTTPGSPGDSQLATYFFDTDLVVTADKVLVDILGECRKYAPRPLPRAVLLPAGPAGVSQLFDVLHATEGSGMNGRTRSSARS